MSNIPKITIEKRIFKLGNDENFVLEYPSNYEEVVNKKLNKLQQDYESTLNNNTNNKIIEDNEKENKEKEEIKDNIKISDNNYYQKLDNKGNNEENEREKNELEPQEGFIEINKNKKEKEDDDENNSEEYYEVEEKEKEVVNNKNEKEKIEKKEKEINLSPIKNPEDIKLSMKKLNFKPPKWAENMTDKDFINMAKNIISSKKNIP